MNSSFSIPEDHLPRRPRLLLLAYLCSPYHGSEEAVGWNRAVQAGRFAHTWVICESQRCEDAVRRYIREHGPVPGVRFVFVPQSELGIKLQKVPGCYYPVYHLWHRKAYAVAQQLHREHQFDLAHMVNIIGFREPGFLWKLPIPFVWGPIGGTQNFPTRFLPILRLRDAAMELTRSVANRVQLWTSRRVRQAARKAAVVLAANSTIERDMVRACHVPIDIMPEVGINRIGDSIARQQSPPGKLRILWSGLIQPHKALSLLLDALASTPGELQWELHVLGKGPLYDRCRRQARRLAIDNRITWLGWRPHHEALKHYAWADVFAFTSLRDTTGTVIVEALSHGVPVVCLDHQGAADVITSECGVKIPAQSPAQAAGDLARALVTLARSPQLRQRLSEGALRRAENYLWSRQGEQMAEVYRRVLASADCDAELRERVEPEPLRWIARSESRV